MFFISHLFHPLTLVPVPPSNTPDDAMSGEAGPAPGASTLAGADPRPAATVSLRTGGWNDGLVSDTLPPGYPNRKNVPRGNTDKAPRRREHPDDGTNETAGGRTTPSLKPLVDMLDAVGDH